DRDHRDDRQSGGTDHRLDPELLLADLGLDQPNTDHPVHQSTADRVCGGRVPERVHSRLSDAPTQAKGRSRHAPVNWHTRGPLCSSSKTLLHAPNVSLTLHADSERRVTMRSTFQLEVSSHNHTEQCQSSLYSHNRTILQKQQEISSLAVVSEWW